MSKYQDDNKSFEDALEFKHWEQQKIY